MGCAPAGRALGDGQWDIQLSAVFLTAHRPPPTALPVTESVDLLLNCMNGLRISTSNRVEVLLDKLVAVVQQPLRSPLDREIIVVQSKGMERWLKQELAARLGVWANGLFPFPNAMVRLLFER